jgi:3-oxoacid CoA-transferase B subunit
MPSNKEIIARRAAGELHDGMYVNLGIGLPTLIANFMPRDVYVVLQTENGALHLGPRPDPGCEDVDRANAGNDPITLLPGGSYFDSMTSFCMIRGGHLDATFLGCFQVDGEGSIASYMIPGARLAGMGGAMDLVVGAKHVFILTEHMAKDGSSKLMKRCTFPLTAADQVDVIITERAVFRRDKGKPFVLTETADGYSVDDIAACTDMTYDVADDVKLGAYATTTAPAHRG